MLALLLLSGSHSAAMVRTSAAMIRSPCARAARARGCCMTEGFGFNVGTWQGVCHDIDPITAEPSFPCATYSCRVALFDQSRVVTTATVGEIERDETFIIDTATDIDLDGTYSAEHSAGMELVGLLAPDARSSSTVIEHSIATSDSERRRCLLVYEGEGGQTPLVLSRVLLLVETREGAAETLAPPCTLTALLGDWVGDASVRRPRAPPPPPPRGFGGGVARKTGDGRPARSAAQQRSEGAGAGTNVYKARLKYAWDGERLVVRRLGVTSFAGDDLDAITSMGRLSSHAGRFGDYDSVSFEMSGDPAAPRMLLLPAGCHVLAPCVLADDGAFSTEFGAMLEAGESFGWKGFVPSEAGEGERGGDDEPSVAPDATDDGAPRLVRVQRLCEHRPAAHE